MNGKEMQIHERGWMEYKREKENLQHFDILAPHHQNIDSNCISGFDQIHTFSVESFMLTTKWIIP